MKILRCEEGLTLVETIIALVLMLVLITAFAGAMVVGLQRYEPRIRYQRCELSTGLERHHGIATTVEDKGRCLYVGCNVSDIEGVESVPHPPRIARRSAAPLHLADPLQGVLSGLGHQKVGEDLAEGTGPFTPAHLDHLGQGARFLTQPVRHILGIGAERVAVIEHEAADPVGMACGIGGGHRPALAQTDQWKACQTGACDHRVEIVDPAIQRSNEKSSTSRSDSPEPRGS